MDYPIQMVSCVCGKHMGTKPGGKKPGEVTHSYCPVCYKAVMVDMEKEDQRSPKPKIKSSDLAEQPDDLEFSLPSHSAQ